jgi:hypothetical protein
VTGSSYIPIVVPIMAFLAMGFWLGLVFYADGHPGYRHSKLQPGPGVAAETAGVEDSRRPDAPPDPAAPTGPGEHQRIDEQSSALLGSGSGAQAAVSTPASTSTARRKAAASSSA